LGDSKRVTVFIRNFPADMRHRMKVEATKNEQSMGEWLAELIRNLPETKEAKSG
tara:strand:- start:1046 stop:1207 length:162 start_codon:yes stop_codon:yes gene_type:complete